MKPEALLLPMSWLYRWLVQAYHKQQREKLPKKLPVPVISIGNLSVGGTGKTEAVSFVVELLHQRGWKPAVLSRGYKRRSTATTLTVSTGAGPLVSPRDAGDEPYMLAQRLAGRAAVVVGQDRYQSGQQAVEHYGCNVLILDDGFQRRYQLFRDLDILLFDAGDEGIRQGWLMPAGRWREPLRNLAEADAYVITRSDQYQTEEVYQLINRYSQGCKPIFFACHQPEAVVNCLTGQREQPAWLQGRKVILVSGIARPQSFYKTVQQCGSEIVHHFQYPDHYQFQTKEINRWIRLAQQHHAVVIMTSKDSVKINWPKTAKATAWMLSVQLTIDPVVKFENMLATLLKGELV